MIVLQWSINITSCVMAAFDSFRNCKQSESFFEKNSRVVVILSPVIGGV